MGNKRVLTGPLIFFAVMAGGGLLLGILLGGLWMIRQQDSVPTVAIVQPSPSTILTSGQGIMVLVEGKSGDGIQRIEFYVDDNFHSQVVAPQSAEGNFQVAFSWFGSQTGVHKLSAIAYDARDRASQPVSLFVGVTSALPDQPVSISEREQESVEAGEQEAAEEQDAPPTSAIPEDQSQPASPGQVVSAQNLQVDQALQGEAHIEEVLEQANLDGNVPFNLPIDQPDPPRNAPPRLQVDSASAREGAGLGVAVRALAEDDIGLDFIYFLVLSDDADSITQTELCEGATRCEKNFQFSFDAGERMVVVRAYDVSGQASQTVIRNFQVLADEGDDGVALVVSDDFNANDLERMDEQADDPQDALNEDDFGEPRISDYPCFGLDVVLEVPYRYVSNHGRQVWATAWVAKDHQLIAMGYVPVEYYTNGVVRFEMEKSSEIDSLITTDQVQLQFRMDDPFSGEVFYTEMADISINWHASLPDLRITRVTRNPSGDTIQVDVFNKGCAPVDGFELSTFAPPDELNWTGTFDESIAPGETRTVTISGLDPNLYSLAFGLEVDPNDRIHEINEYNLYLKHSTRIKEVQFIGVNMDDICEGGLNGSVGEFRVRFTAGDQQRWIPPGENSAFLWAVGWHGFETLPNPPVFSPQVGASENLEIQLKAIENDSGTNFDDLCCWVEIYQSYDILWDRNWKTGGEFSASQPGHCTVYWRVILDE
ncbi:MAG: hypothetical protein H8D34_29565 [Chloroflexi bacterium]|nr:hypothetical protein [Chloroflexota bacterium]